MSMTFYKWQGKQAGCIAPSMLGTPYVKSLLSLSTIIFADDLAFVGSDINSNVYVVTVVQYSQIGT